MLQAIPVKEPLSQRLENWQCRIAIRVTGHRVHTFSMVPPSPHYNLPKPEITTVVVINIRIGPAHCLAQAGPFGPEEPQAFNAGVLATHLGDSNAVNDLAIRLAFIPGDHAN